MQIKNLNGWQRLWVLTSIIYLVFVLFISVIDFPVREKMWIPDDEVLKYVSTKTLLILRDDVDKNGTKWKVDLNNGYKATFPANTKEDVIDSVAKDFDEAVIKFINKKRISFISKMIMLWIVPCITVYVIGLAFLWVYRGFKKGGNNA